MKYENEEKRNVKRSKELKNPGSLQRRVLNSLSLLNSALKEKTKPKLKKTKEAEGISISNAGI